ncbi:MAG TPA: class I SAM-dependent methyltransferase [Solirubrobacteraceae bacterium]|nr:class I SAM-dependent methyltransferase [Solirubrobacteraceae bacterium]
MNADELEERIAGFLNWNYRFEFDNGAITPIQNQGLLNRQEQRRRYFFAALLTLYGGSLAGRRVLDLGSGVGFWALEAAAAGADFVMGIDAREERVTQSRLVFEASGIDPSRYEFEHANLFTRPTPDGFDIVLCLSMLEETARPFELFERFAASGAELVVLECELAPVASSFFAVETLPKRKVIERPLVLVPTRDAVVELAKEFGFDVLALARNMTDYAGLDDYRRRRRLAFFLARGRPLDALAAEPAWQPALAGALARLRG